MDTTRRRSHEIRRKRQNKTKGSTLLAGKHAFLYGFWRVQLPLFMERMHRRSKQWGGTESSVIRFLRFMFTWVTAHVSNCLLKRLHKLLRFSSKLSAFAN